ncbi:MAG: protein phosphatase 2C domain-containing protein [Chromatiaceae bacterium]
MSGNLSPFRWRSAAATDVGKIRSLNEDAYLDRPDVGLWVVADGMGGHDAGDLASRSIVESLAGMGRQTNLGSQVEELRYRLLNVNRALRLEAKRRSESVIGSTVAALTAVGRHAVAMWAGDSRVYLFRAGTLRPLTHDHSQVEELIAEGSLTREQAENHRATNVITRAVGGDDDLRLDAQIQEILDQDICLLCTDGLTKEVKEQEIVETLGDSDPRLAPQALVDLACRRGGRDNVTVVTVQFHGEA